MNISFLSLPFLRASKAHLGVKASGKGRFGGVLDTPTGEKSCKSAQILQIRVLICCLLDNGATLIIDGFTVNFGFLQPYPGSRIVLRGGAKIQKPFESPLGVELVIEEGSIE